LTHPHVLSQHWPAHEPWTDLDEYATRQTTLHRLLLGLIRRTRQRIYLGVSDYSESGFEQRGPLLALINRLLMQNRATDN
jgi:exonuclease V gamma subunit